MSEDFVGSAICKIPYYFYILIDQSSEHLIVGSGHIINKLINRKKLTLHLW